MQSVRPPTYITHLSKVMPHPERDHVPTRLLLISCLEIRIDEDTHDASNVKQRCPRKWIVNEPLDKVLKESH
jgi:hypothetical protein